jgi:4a-hydroxytetrahydrobiopterin dehydratase
MSDLTKRKCKPCDGNLKALTPDEARLLGGQVRKWKIRKDEPRLWREYTFKDFMRAIKFVNKVAEIAEAEGHHPDVHIHYNLVKLVLWTHDLGGLSENDFILAAKIDELNG